MSLVLTLLAACGAPTCPEGQAYSPVFAQCIGEEEVEEAPPPSTPTGATGDTGP